jgi:hypothetical protein
VLRLDTDDESYNTMRDSNDSAKMVPSADQVMDRRDEEGNVKDACGDQTAAGGH